MKFAEYLAESEMSGFEQISPDHLNILKQEIDRNSLKVALDKEYVEKSELTVKIVNDEFYLSGIKLESEDKVIIKGSFIAEITEEGGYIYNKPVDFVYDMSDNTLISVKDNDSVRNENWKDVQNFILRTAKKV